MRVEGAPGADGPSASSVFTAEIHWIVWPETFPSAICTLEGVFYSGFCFSHNLLHLLLFETGQGGI